MPKTVLVIGGGSVGKRHARNLAAEGCDIALVEPREDRRAELAGEMRLAGNHATLEAAMAAQRYDGVVVASPPAFHVVQVETCLAAKLPVFLEKPVCPRLADAQKLKIAAAASSTPLLLGYTWRWWPPFLSVRRHLAAKTVGTLRHVKFTLAAHLADWHPYERYQDFFMASAALGGGALLDESHWIDLLLWFFGPPHDVMARVEKISDLEIDTDDNVDLLIGYDSGLRVSMHLDLYGRPHEKYIQFSGEKGTMRWSEVPNEVATWTTGSGQWAREVFDCQRNDMFVDAIREYLSLLSGSTSSLTCTLDDGLDVLRVAEAARLSHAQGRRVALQDVS
jgi:predicted dehydrogenase